jgi:hypothetical protein
MVFHFITNISKVPMESHAVIDEGWYDCNKDEH